MRTSASYEYHPFGAPLTPRQREVMALVAEGLLNREIAVRMEISLQTVKNTLRGAYQRLGARNRVAAVAKADRWGGNALVTEDTRPCYCPEWRWKPWRDGLIAGDDHIVGTADDLVLVDTDVIKLLNQILHLERLVVELRAERAQEHA